MKVVTVELKVKVKVKISMKEQADLQGIVDELDVVIEDTTGEASVLDSEILDYEIMETL